MTRFLRLWDQLPFLARLLGTAAIALGIAGLTMVLVSARDEARSSYADLAEELESELETLPAAIAEVVVIGDYATLQQTLDRYVKRPRIFRVTFTDLTGVTLASQDRERAHAAPRWFSTLLHFENLGGDTQVMVGGRRYGTLALEVTAQDFAYRAWVRVGTHMVILLMAVILNFLGIWLVLRTGLAPLRHLEAGAARLADGRLDIRLPEEGSPELRRLYTFSQRLNAQLSEGNESEALVSLDFIQQEALRLRGLLHDIELYLAAGEALGKLQAQNTEEVAHSVRMALMPEITRTQGHIEIEPLPPIILDRRRLEELFHIAFENGLRYARPQTPPRIVVSATHDESGVELRVADNGTGIAEEFRDRVFRVFERLDTSQDGRSTGIGLSIIRRIAESTGGGAWIEESDMGGITLAIKLGQETVV
ncbi:conserved protein of unknown function（contain Histidine kinase-like domain&|uniref:ATP-binding protein n=1 Tax=Magnetospirillum sp. XM-1 TaxID=1663591 RepID=UPI00073DC6AE|nr:ATP-binding protein [Magnetospirillum sp. XM-1]CUW37850.1 conserved protein of unknown function\